MPRLRPIALLLAAVVAVAGCGGSSDDSREVVADDVPSVAFEALARAASGSAELALARMIECAASGYSAACLRDALGDTKSYADQVLSDLGRLEGELPEACGDQLADVQHAIRRSEDLLVAVIVAADQGLRAPIVRALDAATDRIQLELRPLQNARCR